MDEVEDGTPPPPAYNEALKRPIETAIGSTPRAQVHRVEWAKVVAGDPVEINPSVGAGFKVMTVEEWTCRWKRNDDFPDCLSCGSTRTKEHHFVQTWCRGQRQWESETLCLDCHSFSWRAYSDPGFLVPEEYEKHMWSTFMADTKREREAARAQEVH